jgi:predicted MFS family arabinose efflux permease
MNLGFGFGALLGGVIFEATGGYDAALIANVALGVVAAILAALVPAFGHERRRRTLPLPVAEKGSVPARAVG